MFTAARTRQTQHKNAAMHGNLDRDPSSCARTWFWRMFPFVSPMHSGAVQDHEPFDGSMLGSEGPCPSNVEQMRAQCARRIEAEAGWAAPCLRVPALRHKHLHAVAGKRRPREAALRVGNASVSQALIQSFIHSLTHSLARSLTLIFPPTRVKQPRTAWEGNEKMRRLPTCGAWRHAAPQCG